MEFRRGRSRRNSGPNMERALKLIWRCCKKSDHRSEGAEVVEDGVRRIKYGIKFLQPSETSRTIRKSSRDNRTCSSPDAGREVDAGVEVGAAVVVVVEAGVLLAASNERCVCTRKARAFD
jgi:hypothetical protein